MLQLLERLGEQKGWRRHLAAFALGLLAALALPPYHLFFLLIPAFGGLTLLLAAAGTAGTAARTGWSFAFGYFLLGLYWIPNALLVDADRFAWAWPIAVTLLPAGLALFFALAGWLAWRFARGANWLDWRWPLTLGAVWSLAEWLRGWLFTGFPWNAVGYVWTFDDAAMQIYAVTGVVAAGWLALWIAASFPVLLLRKPSAAWIAPLAALLIGGGFYLYGQSRIAAHAHLPMQEDVLLRLVQPNIAQENKWRRELRDQHLETLMQLSSAPGLEKVTHILWPETAPPFDLAGDHARRRLIATLAPDGGALLTGAVRVFRTSAGPQIYNSLVALDRRGEILAAYDKTHLVPFGEYLPFRPLLEKLGLDKIVQGLGDFQVGKLSHIMAVPGLPEVRPLICYEGIFPAEIRPAGRAQWLLNVTNDAWYGDSPGPRQHLMITRVRAVEQGLPLMRVANTGISAAVDPLGRVMSRLALLERGVVDSPLPKALADRPFYALIGDILFAALTMLWASIVFVIRPHGKSGIFTSKSRPLTNLPDKDIQ